MNYNEDDKVPQGFLVVTLAIMAVTTSIFIVYLFGGF